MQKQLSPSVKGHLIQGAFYVLLLLVVCVIPLALAQPITTNSATEQKQAGQSAHAFAVPAPDAARPRPTPRTAPTRRPQPTPRAQQKPQPAGIVRLFNIRLPRPENDRSWTNPNIDGMRLRPFWSEVNRDLKPSIGAQLTGCSVLPRNTASLSVFQLVPEPVRPSGYTTPGR